MSLLIEEWSKPFTLRGGDGSATGECPICYTDLPELKTSDTVICCAALDPETGQSVGCKNMFHSGCLLKWIKTTKDAICCPFCRQRNSLIVPWDIEVVYDMNSATQAHDDDDDDDFFDNLEPGDYKLGGKRCRIFFEDLLLHWVADPKTSEDVLFDVLRLNLYDRGYKGVSASLLYDHAQCTRPPPWVVKAREYNTFVTAALASGSFERVKAMIREQMVSMEDLCKATDPRGNTMLMLSIMNDCQELTRQLLVHGADVYRQNKFGEDAILCAIRRSQWKRIDEMIRFGGNGKHLPLAQVQTYLIKAASLSTGFVFYNLVKHYVEQIDSMTLIKEQRPYWIEVHRYRQRECREILTNAILGSFSTACFAENCKVMMFIIKTHESVHWKRLLQLNYVYQLGAKRNAAMVYFLLQRGSPLDKQVSYCNWCDFGTNGRTFRKNCEWKAFLKQIEPLIQTDHTRRLKEMYSNTLFFDQHIHEFETNISMPHVVRWKTDNQVSMCAYEVFLAHLILNWKYIYGEKLYRAEIATSTQCWVYDTAVALAKPLHKQAFNGYTDATMAEKEALHKYILQRLFLPTIAASGVQVLLCKPHNTHTLIENIIQRGAVSLLRVIVETFQLDLQQYAPDALHVAIESKNWATFDYLMQLPAHPFNVQICAPGKRNGGWLPLNCATYHAKGSKSRFVQALVRDPRMNIFVKGRNDRNAFMMCCLEKNPGVVKQILSSVAPETVKKLLEIKNALGQTALEQTLFALDKARQAQAQAQAQAGAQAQETFALQEIVDTLLFFKNHPDGQVDKKRKRK